MRYKRLIVLTLLVLFLLPACSGNNRSETAIPANTSYVESSGPSAESYNPAPAETRPTPPNDQSQQPSETQQQQQQQAEIDAPAQSGQSIGNIYLFGEVHGVEAILNRELELWNDYYHNHNLRHLFIEYGYCNAEFLNLWMQSDSDDILDSLYRDWAGSSAHNPNIKNFFIDGSVERCYYRSDGNMWRFRQTTEEFLIS